MQPVHFLFLPSKDNGNFFKKTERNQKYMNCKRKCSKYINKRKAAGSSAILRELFSYLPYGPSHKIECKVTLKNT